MSARQSLYGQSLLRNANTATFSSEPQEKRWKRDWFSPVKASASTTASTGVGSNSATPTPFGDERETPETSQKVNFSVMTWLVDTDYTPVADGDESDFIDLTLYSTDKTSSTSNGLSDDAIRGAVANDDSIPGLSKEETSTPAVEPVS